MADFKVIGEVDLDASTAQKGLDGLQNMIKNLGLVALFAEATKAAVDLGKAVIDLGSDFESSMAKTKTLFNGTGEEFQQLQEDILNISSATGQSAKTLAEAAYSAESAGVAQEDLATMIEQSSKLATAGFTDVDTALSATVKAMNAYGMTGEQAIGKVQKVLIQTQNKGITTVGELGQHLSKVTPTAAAFGVSFEQVGASLAGMTAQSGDAAQATTFLNALISELGKSGTTASDNLKAAAEGTQYADMSFKQMMESGATLNEVLDLMSTYAHANGLEIADMFGSMEAGRGAMQLDASDFIANLEAMSTEADVVTEGFETMSATFEIQSQRVVTAAQNMGIMIYESMQGTLAEMAQYAADTMDTLIQAYQDDGIAGLSQALLNIIVNGIPELIKGLTDLIRRGTEWLKGEGSDETFDAGFDAFHQLVKGLGDTLPDLLAALGELIWQALVTLVKHWPDFLSAGADLIWQLISGILGGAGQLLWSITQPIRDAWNSIISTNWLDLGWNIITGIAQGIWNAAGQLWDALIGAVSNAWDGALRWLGIRSPSRRAREQIGHNVMRGMALGFEEDETAEAAITDQARNIVEAAQAELNASKWRLSNVLVDTNATAEQRLNASWTGESTTIIELDGHELARASAPYLDEQLAFEGV